MSSEGDSNKCYWILSTLFPGKRVAATQFAVAGDEGADIALPRIALLESEDTVGRYRYFGHLIPFLDVT